MQVKATCAWQEASLPLLSLQNALFCAGIVFYGNLKKGKSCPQTNTQKCPILETAVTPFLQRGALTSTSNSYRSLSLPYVDLRLPTQALPCSSPSAALTVLCRTQLPHWETAKSGFALPRTLSSLS